MRLATSLLNKDATSRPGAIQVTEIPTKEEELYLMSTLGIN